MLRGIIRGHIVSTRKQDSLVGSKFMEVQLLKNGNLTDDYIIAGDSNPLLHGTFGLNGEWKGLGLSLLFSYSVEATTTTKRWAWVTLTAPTRTFRASTTGISFRA